MGRRPFVKTLVLLGVVALLAAACGSNKPGTTAPKKGGSIVIGAEQWADCMNPITSCASGYYQTMQTWEVLPRAINYDLAGNPKAGPMITEVPTLQNGGLKENPFTVTYHINPKAVWAPDGTPITSKDWDFTWKAIMNTVGTYTTAGYDLITSIDTTDPATVVIKFKSTYADWVDLFGGNHFGVLEAAKFPNANKDKPELSKEMATGPVPFSGGPWLQTAFTQTTAVFERNTKFWGKQTLLDKMTWVPEDSQTTEINDLLSGTISAAFPQPSNVSISKQLASNPNAKSVAGTGVFYEAFWLNTQDPVLKDKAVRQAFFYSVDRQQIIDGLIHLNAPQATILNCGPFAIPGHGPWCNTTPWDVYKYDPAKAKSILTADGWDCSKVPTSPCTKSGKSLAVTYRYCNGNLRRGTIFDLIKEKIKPAGFALSHGSQGNGCSDPLFTKTLPKGDYQVADYAQGPIAADPSPTSNFACDYIPTAKNQYAGGNYPRWCNTSATALMKQSDATLDPTDRIKLLDQAWNAMATTDFVMLPIYNLPNITIWRADKIAGPVGQANSSPYSGFINADEWYLKGGATSS